MGVDIFWQESSEYAAVKNKSNKERFDAYIEFQQKHPEIYNFSPMIDVVSKHRKVTT